MGLGIEKPTIDKFENLKVPMEKYFSVTLRELRDM